MKTKEEIKERWEAIEKAFSDVRRLQCDLNEAIFEYEKLQQALKHDLDLVPMKPSV